MHIKDLLDAIVIQAMSVELFKLVNDTARIFRQYRFSGRNILASESIPRNTLASRNLNIPGKTEHFFHHFTSSEDGEEDGEEEKGACVL